MSTEYGADQIQILEGLEAVRKRPGMYIGSTSIRGLHHLVYEIVDNAVDEALAGFCDVIDVKIQEDNSITVMEGVVMGTRSGNIDPAIMEFIAKKENLDISQIMNVLNKKSGLFGLSGGLSSDFRDLNEAAEGGNQDAANAIDVLAYGIAKFVGGYVAAMNGVDAIVFTAGIGENAIPVREKVVSYLGYLGVTLDKDANGHRGEEIVISTPDSKVKVAVIPTNEELAICRETVALV